MSNQRKNLALIHVELMSFENKILIDVLGGQVQRSVVVVNFRLFKRVLMENRDVITGPVLTLIPQLFALPFFIFSFALNCIDFLDLNIRYALAASYIASFIPQFACFFLYVSSSSFYRQQWQRTILARSLKHIRNQRVLNSTTNATTRVRLVTGKVSVQNLK